MRIAAASCVGWGVLAQGAAQGAVKSKICMKCSRDSRRREGQKHFPGGRTSSCCVISDCQAPILTVQPVILRLKTCTRPQAYPEVPQSSAYLSAGLQLSIDLCHDRDNYHLLPWGGFEQCEVGRVHSEAVKGVQLPCIVLVCWLAGELEYV